MAGDNGKNKKAEQAKKFKYFGILMKQKRIDKNVTKTKGGDDEKRRRSR